MPSSSSKKRARSKPSRICPDSRKAWGSVHTSKRSCRRNPKSAFLALPTETRLHILSLCFAGAQMEFRAACLLRVTHQIRTSCAEAVGLLRVSHQIRSEVLDILFADHPLSCCLYSPNVALLTEIAPGVLGNVRRVSLKVAENFTGIASFVHAFPALQCLEVDLGDLLMRSDGNNRLVDGAPGTFFYTQVGDALLVRAATRVLTTRYWEKSQNMAVAGMAPPEHGKHFHIKGCEREPFCGCYRFDMSVEKLLELREVYADKDRGFNLVVRGQVDAFSRCTCCRNFVDADGYFFTADFHVVFVVDVDRALVLLKTVKVHQPPKHRY